MSTSGHSDNGRVGLICRYQDNNNFYFFAVDNDQTYIIGKYRNGVVSLIGMSSPGYSTAIHLRGANEIKAWCVGNELTLTVSGERLPPVYDSDFPSGDIGLIAMDGDGEGMTASFDYILAEQ
jgi:hypothetical protein